MNQFLGRTLDRESDHTASAFSHDQALRTGILLTNLGTPDAPNRASLRRYLKEFLSDPRVVEAPRLLWWLILNGVILNIRPGRSAESYGKIWMPEGSPLWVYSKKLVDDVAAGMAGEAAPSPVVELAMRYGEPSLPGALRRMHDAGIDRLLVLPLYPQYSGSTTGSTFDAVARELARWRWVPTLRFINGYHDHERYIDALAQHIRQARETRRGELLLMSFHGLPRRYLDQGDPYYCQCHATARMLARRLDLNDNEWQVVFQSRFGREPWLQPYCDETLKALPGRGVRSVDVVCPGFAVDCLETLEEIAMQNRALFEEAGGESFQYIPCLNDEAVHRNLMLDLVRQHARDWFETGRPSGSEALTGRQARARALGARA